MKELYLDTISVIERLHRLFLDVVKGELDRLGVYDINNVQALVLYNIGRSQLSITELTSRGYYLGSNVSYNLRKMVEHEYVNQETSKHDRRSSLVHLTPKGLDLYKRLDSAFGKHVTQLIDQGIPLDDLRGVLMLLRRIEVGWGGFRR